MLITAPSPAAARACALSENGCFTPRDLLVVLVALAGHQDHVLRRGGTATASAIARAVGLDLAASRVRQPGRIWLDDASGSSLRGLSLVTTTRSAFFSATAAISGRLVGVAVAAAAEHAPQLPPRRCASGRAPAAPSRARRACARSPPHQRLPPASCTRSMRPGTGSRPPQAPPRRPAARQRAQHPDHAQQVGHVVLADQRVRSACRARRPRPRRSAGRSPLGDVAWRRSARPRSQDEVHRSSTAGCSRSLQVGAFLVVHVDHGGRRPGQRNSASLALPVGFHAAVVVQVVLGEVGEDGTGCACRPAGARRCRWTRPRSRRRRSPRARSAEAALQQHRVGRGQAGVVDLRRPPDAERADHPAGHGLRLQP